MSSSPPLKVLIVDDTVVYRKIVSDVMADIPDVKVVGTAHNGKAALLKIKTLQPDLLTLDIEMPEMSGLELLQHMKSEHPHVGAIMLSTLTQKGGSMTMRALELGAFDFVPKPQAGTLANNKKAVKDALLPMLQAFQRSRAIRGAIRTVNSGHQRRPSSNRPRAQVLKTPLTPPQKRSGPSSIVGIGISTGGPNALAQVLPQLPGDIGVPVVIVQHMPAMFTQSLAKSLNSKCALEVHEAVNGEPLHPNKVYIAPGGKQMKIVAGADGRARVIKITNDPPENSCRPSVDYLFRSIAELYVGRATGVIMTGMGSDGTAGLIQMKNSGAFIIAQDESTCVVFGMPKDPIERGIVDVVSPLGMISKQIINTLPKQKARW
ncbi:MAG: chemotaxis response regulator protein-glutamate methylesterase [Desulfobacteraceae bacterium]|jgi:two-component system chemotaxis response regulator CheB